MSSTVIQPVSHPLWRKLRQWAPTVFWMGAIAAFSTDTFSAAHTGGILRKIIDAIYPGMPAQSFETLHFFIRKSAHFTVYGMLSWLAFLSWRVTLPAARRWTFAWSGLAMALTFCVASLDEFHQSFLASRTASPRDVMLDMTGALFFQLLIAIFLSRPTAGSDHKRHEGTQRNLDC